jgi:hypothetical protein
MSTPQGNEFPFAGPQAPASAKRDATSRLEARETRRAWVLWLGVATVSGLGSGMARADEGMWTFDNFPKDLVESRYGFAPSDEWLDTVRAASVRLGNGCSGSFVSKRGLILTNHHCVLRCVQQLSTADENLVESGFYAEKMEDERRCPGLEVNRLESIEDVTERVAEATKGKEGEAYVSAKNAVIADIESGCGSDETTRCDVVELYGGGLHHLYRYRRFQDVRLVFAPSVKAAFFGGDPDNFNFPRYAFDAAFLRPRVDDRAVRVKEYLRWSKKGVDDGDLVFVSGHPGRTNRLKTVAELEYLRDWGLPEVLLRLAEERGLLAQFSRASSENERIARGRLFGVENGLKALQGRRAALADDTFFGTLVEAETEFRGKLAGDDETLEAFREIAEAMERYRVIRTDLRYKERHRNYGSKLFGHALDLIRWKEEQQKPNADRLPEYAEAKKPALKAGITSAAPIYPSLEQTLLGHYFTRLRADLGPDDPFVKAVLGDEAPFALADRLVKETRLADPELREKWFDDPGSLDVDADPMLKLAKVISDAGREIRSVFEDEIESVVDRARAKIADARFRIYGTETYPDATFSLRLSFGAVKGFPDRGKEVPPFTRVRGLYERATGNEPFALSPRWKEKKDAIDLSTPMNFVTTNDIIGGNSGSPAINRAGRIVGLVFDGNIHSLGGDFGFDPRVNRAVSVDVRVIREGLRHVYGAKRLLKEIR